MFGVLKIIFYIAPFIKEVFYQSDEERRVWVGRMIIVLGIAFVCAWTVVSWSLDEYHSLERENASLRETIELLRKDAAKCDISMQVANESLRTKQKNYEDLFGQNITLDKRIVELNQTIHELSTKCNTTPKTEHSLEAKPRLREEKRGSKVVQHVKKPPTQEVTKVEPKVIKESELNKNPPKPTQTKKSSHQDRIGDIY